MWKFYPFIGWHKLKTGIKYLYRLVVIFIFDDRLKKMRIARGLSQTQIAKELGMPQKTYCNYERNEREPSSTTLIKIATYFGVSLDYLLNYHCESSTETIEHSNLGIFSSNSTQKSEMYHLIVQNYGKETAQTISSFMKLDAIDQAKISERIDTMLESEKYSLNNLKQA